MEKELFSASVIGIVFDASKRKILVEKRINDEDFRFVEDTLTHDLEIDKGLKKVIKDQTGYSVHNLGSIYAENKLEDRKKINLYFLCEIKSGQEKKGENIKELEWINPCKAEKIMNKKFPTRLKEFIINLGHSCDIEN